MLNRGAWPERSSAQTSVACQINSLFQTVHSANSVRFLLSRKFSPRVPPEPLAQEASADVALDLGDEDSEPKQLKLPQYPLDQSFSKCGPQVPRSGPRWPQVNYCDISNIQLRTKRTQSVEEA